MTKFTYLARNSGVAQYDLTMKDYRTRIKETKAVTPVHKQGMVFTLEFLNKTMSFSLQEIAYFSGTSFSDETEMS